MAIDKKDKKEKVKQVSVVDIDFLRKELKKEVVELEENFDYFLTGNPIFDAFVGSGGLPKYQLEYIWATTSVGKSTLAIQILASYMKQTIPEKCIILYLDTEETITAMRMRSLGIENTDHIMVLNPETIERVGVIISTIRAKYKDVELFIIWDTIAQTPAAEEIDGYVKIGMQARSLTSLFRLTKFYSTKLTMFALNQYRESNFEANAKYMPKEPPGGNAVKHKSFLTLFGTRKKSELVSEDFGYVSSLTTRKSKIISPHRKFDFEFTNTGGYDAILTAVNFLRTQKLMGKKDGGYYFFVDDKDKTWRLNKLYSWFLTDESVPKWKFVINEIFSTLYPDDNAEFINQAKQRIFDYYFKNDKIDLDKFTSLTKKMFDKDESISTDKDIEGILDRVNAFIDSDEITENDSNEDSL